MSAQIIDLDAERRRRRGSAVGNHQRGPTMTRWSRFIGSTAATWWAHQRVIEPIQMRALRAIRRGA